MRFERSLQKNILWMILSRYGSQGLAVVSSLVLARYLGGAGFGEYAFISAVVMIGNALSTFGTDMVLIRRISADQDFTDLPTALVIQLLVSLIIIVCVFILHLVNLIPVSLLVYVLSLIPLSFFTVFTIALRGTQKMDLFSTLHFGMAFLQLAAVVILISWRGNVFDFALLLLGVQLASALFGYYLCISQIKNFPTRWRFSWARIPALLYSSLSMAAIGTLRLVYEKLSMTLLPALSGITETGLFSASLRVTDAARLGHMSALTAIYPEMARDKKFRTHRTDFGLLLFAVACISLTLFLLSKQIIFILFGSQFIESVSSLRILAWILVPNFFVLYYSLAFVALGIEKPVLRSLTASLLLMLTLLVTLSPLDGLRGAAIALLSTEIFQAMLLWLQWRTHAISKFSK